MDNFEYEEDENLMEQFKKTNDIFHTEFLLNEKNFGENEMRRCSLLLDNFNTENILNFTLAPNFSCNSTYKPPSGFMLEVKENTKLSPVMFDASKFWYGSTIYKLPKNTRFQDNGDFLTHLSLGQRAKKINENILSSILTKNTPNHLTPNLMTKSGSYVGLYSEDERNSYNYTTNWYLVVQNGHYESSAELYRKIEEYENETFESFFNDIGVDIVENIVSNNHKNRINILNQFLISMGINPNQMGVSNYSKTFVTNTIEKDKNRKSFKFWSKCMGKEVFHNNQSLLQQENPYVGPTLIESKSISLNDKGPFPYCTGKNSNLKDSDIKLLSIPDHIVSKNSSKRLSENFYRSRNEEWLKLEKKILFGDSSNENIKYHNLIPRLVRISD